MSQAGLVDIEGSHPQIPTEFVTDDGIAVPLANVLEILGTAVPNQNIPIQTTGSGNTVTIEIQYATSNATTDATKAGVASFNSTQFIVDANGFVSLTGGGLAIDSIAVQTGTSPIVPTVAGLVTINGAVVSAGTNPIRSDGTGANTMALEVQISQAIAASNATNIGLSAFNSAFFTVDANGFVSVSSTGLGQTITGQSGGALSPTAGNWNIFGNSVAAGSNPVVTSGAVSTITVNVQRAQAIASTNATNVGLAAFNSAQFTVDANGFVSLAGGGLAIDSIALQTGTSPISPDSAGLITFNGSTVVAGTNPVRTNGTGANTMALQIQFSQAIASTNATNVGLAAFNSAQFTVDANGFVSASGALAITYTENSGSATPAAGNLNILGTNSALTGFSPWTTGTGSTVTLNMPGTAKWVVNPTANLGTHTTIASAIAAASSGETIFVTPGTYTENLTLKAGVDIVSFTGEDSTPNVTIIGNATLSTAGTVTISNIRLQTNSAAFLTVSGSAASIVNLNHCYLNSTNATGISYSSSSASSSINVFDCMGNLGTTGIGLYTMSSIGSLSFTQCGFTNSGASLTASSNSAGIVFFAYSVLASPVSSSSAGFTSSTYTFFVCTALNVTALTTAGTGLSSCYYCGFFSGSASAISVGSGTTLTSISCTISSTNTNAITGAGTLISNSTLFSGASHQTNVTTQSGGAASGLTQGTAPSAGFIGEQIRSYQSSPVSMAHTTVTNITSISLTAGIWDLSGMVNITATNTNTTNPASIVSIVTASAGTGNVGDNAARGTMPSTAGTVGTTIDLTLSIPCFRVIVTSTTTYFLTCYTQATVTFGATAIGRISATRVG